MAKTWENFEILEFSAFEGFTSVNRHNEGGGADIRIFKIAKLLWMTVKLSG